MGSNLAAALMMWISGGTLTTESSYAGLAGSVVSDWAGGNIVEFRRSKFAIACRAGS